MATIEQFLKAIKYKISESTPYCWECYGKNAFSLDYWNGDHDGFSVGMVYDNKNQRVFEMTLCDYKNSRAYRWIDPKYVKKHEKELLARHLADTAWDNVYWTATMSSDDILDKISCIMDNRKYSTSSFIAIPVDYDVMRSLATIAAKRNCTVNEIVEDIITQTTVENLLKISDF